MIERLHEAIKAVCPIIGVSVPTIGTSAGVSIQFDPSATAPQQANAQSVVAGFDWSQSAHNTWMTSGLRTQAKNTFASSAESIYKLLRCQSDIIRQQLNDLGAFVGAATSIWDPPNIANGAGSTSPNITVNGAAFGDFVDVGVPYSLSSLICVGFVSAANTVAIRLHNGTGAGVNLGSGTWRVVVRRQPGNRTLVQLRTAIENMIDSGLLD